MRRKDSQKACIIWTAVPRNRGRAGTKETEAKESDREDGCKLTTDNERGRLDSSNDDLHDEQGRVYIHALYLPWNSEIIRNENGT